MVRNREERERLKEQYLSRLRRKMRTRTRTHTRVRKHNHTHIRKNKNRRVKLSQEYNPPLRAHIVYPKFMWVPVHKAACTSIANAIAELLETDPLDGLKSYRTMSPEKNEDLFYFMFVRNPWDRMVSLWSMYSKALDYPSFDSFIHRFFFDTNYRCYWEHDEHAQIQCTYPIREPDFIGRFENLRTDWKYVRNQTGLPELEHLGKTKHFNYRLYYSQDTKEIIAKIYIADIEKFGYKF